ncbi:MAG: hypothetical protein L6Q70_12975 [Thauera sp.]|nr:hypothetical protein [Thauera sp.]
MTVRATSIDALEIGPFRFTGAPAHLNPGMRDEVAVECPVHVGRQRQAIARIVVTRFAEGMNVRRLDHRSPVRQHEP